MSPVLAIIGEISKAIGAPKTGESQTHLWVEPVGFFATPEIFDRMIAPVNIEDTYGRRLKDRE